MKFLVHVLWAMLALVVLGATGTAYAAPPRSLTREALHGRLLGPVAPQAPIKVHVLLYGQHEAELDELIEAQNTPGSRDFGHYLTPQEFGRYFGAAPSTYERAISVLRANGFTIVDLANNRRDIVARAPAAAVSAFFRTPLDLHADGGRVYYAARYAPLIPATLPARLVTGLNDYHVLHSHLSRRPRFIDNNGDFSWSPQDVAHIYDLNPLYAAGLTGAGIALANATSGAATQSDLSNFQSTFKLPAAQLVSTAIDGALSTTCGHGCANDESTLDMDWATATARNVTFHQVVAHTTAGNDFDDVYAYIADKLATTTHIASTSFGSCEQDQDPDEEALDNGYFKQSAAEGQWWFAASGDHGTDDCQDGSTTALSVDFPASSPYVVAVGGTDVHATVDANGNVTKYNSESVWQYGNCGETDGLSSDEAGGGGKSVVYAKPSYQAALTPADGRRDVPDVSLLADDVNDGLFIYNRTLQAGNGGTSEAAPQWAGLFAIIEQKKANYKNVIDPHVRLYQLAASASHASYFHDVIGGNNGDPACSNDFTVFAGYTAVTGYDRASGIGSYQGANLVNAY